jgi:hypothetical protein
MEEPTGRSGIDRVQNWIQEHALGVGLTAAVSLVAAAVLGAVALAGPNPAGTPQTPPGNTSPSGEAAAPEGSIPPGERLPANTYSLVAVKVDNAPAARPQGGLNQARYLVEVPVEGGMTRFLAFVEPAVDVIVGPVRSARPVDVDLVGVASDTLVSTGGRPFVLGPLAANGIRLVGADPELPSPFQTLERPAPHDQFVATIEVTGGEPVTSGIPADVVPAGTGTTDHIEIPYASPVSWDFSDGLYTRSEEGTVALVFSGPDLELAAEPFTSETIVVMSVVERSAGYRDVNGAEVPTFDVIGSGSLLVFSGGAVVEGTWSRASLHDPYVFHTADGTSFGLPEMRTFIHLLPRDLTPTW